jgi:hypothetical protein
LPAAASASISGAVMMATSNAAPRSICVFNTAAASTV